MKLKDKIIVVTGGTRGIGKAIVEAFAKQGAQVIFTYLNNDSIAKDIEHNLKKTKFKAHGYKVDIKDFDAVNKFREQVITTYGKIDVLVNNAGIIRDKALALMNKEDWTDVIDTNLNGVFNFTRAFIVTFLKQKQGSVINISSISGLIGLSRQTNYSASKAGIIGFSKALAKEVAPYNVRVNVVCPGYISTDMVSGLGDVKQKQILDMIPVKRMGQPEEVADLCIFLASDKSRYIIGEVIKIDGGLAI